MIFLYTCFDMSHILEFVLGMLPSQYAVVNNLHVHYLCLWRVGSPDPIPNSEVKQHSVENTCLETGREGRTVQVH